MLMEHRFLIRRCYRQRQTAAYEVNDRVDKFGYNALGQLATVSDGATAKSCKEE